MMPSVEAWQILSQINFYHVYGWNVFIIKPDAFYPVWPTASLYIQIY